MIGNKEERRLVCYLIQGKINHSVENLGVDCEDSESEQTNDVERYRMSSLLTLLER